MTYRYPKVCTRAICATPLLIVLLRILATVQKIVQDILASEPGMTFAKDSRDLLIECCVEFITLISSEANEIAEKDAKKTIACEHVKAALEELGFGDYVPAILEVAQDYKKQQQVSFMS